MSDVTDAIAKAEFPVKLEGLFKKSRYKVLFGGRGGAKSWGIARALLIKGAKDPIRILCAREFQTSIKDSVHKLLCDQIESLGLLSFYEITQTSIMGKPNLVVHIPISLHGRQVVTDGLLAVLNVAD